MPFAENWIETEPDGGITTVSQLDNWIRSTKVAIRERLEDSIIEPGTWAAAPKIKAGAVGVSVSPLAAQTYMQWGPESALLIPIPGLVATAQVFQASMPVAGYPKMLFGVVNGTQWIWPCIPTSNVGDFPASGTTDYQGLIGVDQTNNRLVVFSQNVRNYINFDGTF